MMSLTRYGLAKVAHAARLRFAALRKPEACAT